MKRKEKHVAKKKRKVTVKEIRAAREFLKRVNVLKTEIGKKRDQLRATFEELEGILMSLEDADGMIMDGSRSISDGLDRMSELL